jgi:hypothetical protein
MGGVISDPLPVGELGVAHLQDPFVGDDSDQLMRRRTDEIASPGAAHRKLHDEVSFVVNVPLKAVPRSEPGR